MSKDKEIEKTHIKFECARKVAATQLVQTIKNVIETVEEEKPENSLSESKQMTPVMCAKFYTNHNVSVATLTNYLNVVSYKDWMSETISQNSMELLETKDDYRKFFRLFYIHRRKIPTLDILIQYFNKCVPYTENILYPLRRAGFIWKQLPGTNKAVIVEDPEKFYQRIQYLQTMTEWRKSHRPILYVEFLNLSRTVKKIRQCDYYEVVAVSTLTGLVQTHKEPFSPCSSRWLIEWIESLLNKIKVPHLFVLVLDVQNKIKYVNSLHSTKLKMTSPKKEIIQWLAYNEIPHSPDDHRAELYTLVQKCRSNCKPEQSIMEKIKHCGHDLVIQPIGMLDLAVVYKSVVLKVYTTGIKLASSLEERISRIIQEITLQQWRLIDSKAMSHEKEIYREDMEMETVIDKLMELGKYGRISAKELKSLNNFTPLLGRNKYPDIVMID